MQQPDHTPANVAIMERALKEIEVACTPYPDGVTAKIENGCIAIGNGTKSADVTLAHIHHGVHIEQAQAIIARLPSRAELGDNMPVPGAGE